jgi:tRNA (guanine10-N2)-dimethyltransferase
VQREILLSGEHPTLPSAELRALLDVHDPEAVVELGGLVARVTGTSGPGLDAALARVVLAHEWGEPWADGRDDAHGLAALNMAVRVAADGRGTMAVAAQRRGRERSVRLLQVERSLGGALAEAGHAIDLRQPDRVLYAWLADGYIHAGERLGVVDRAAFDGRAGDRRSHFSPVSLHPRRAASLVHLARIPPGGTLYDPFCGTGCIVLEAALEGYHVLASDADEFMVQGTHQTLADVPPAPRDVEAFVSDIGDAPGLAGTVDGIVTDLPYGRSSTTGGEDAGDLYERAFAAFAQILQPGGYAVIGHAEPELLEPIDAYGFEVVERHAERAHKSLVRHFAVVKRVAAVEDGA